MRIKRLQKPFWNWYFSTNLSVLFELVLCCQFFLKLTSDSKTSCRDRHTEYDQVSLVPLGGWTKMMGYLGMLNTHPSSYMGAAILFSLYQDLSRCVHTAGNNTTMWRECFIQYSVAFLHAVWSCCYLSVASLLWSKTRQFSHIAVARCFWTISHSGHLMSLGNHFTILNLFEN